MNSKELRETIGNTNNPKWFTEEVNFKFSFVDFDDKISGFSAIYKFIDRQVEGWEKHDQLPNILDNSYKYFKTLKNEIERFYKNNTESDLNRLKSNWTTIISNYQKNKYNNLFLFICDSAESEFLIELFSLNINSVGGAVDFITNQRFNYNIANKDYFIGWNLAYEFIVAKSDLPKRRSSEKKSLGKIRSDYNRYVERAELNLNELIQNNQKSINDYTEKIDNLIKEKDDSFTSWFETSKSKFESFNEESNKNISDFESLYKEKLKLEAPATYWRERALKLRKEGNLWLLGVISTAVFSVFVLIYILNKITDGTLEELFETPGSAIRWSIIFITLISFLAYAIRTFAKLSFSSYHLVRDAEEREQLSFVYLALKKEKNIDEKERHLVMQSLFSRAETGLLKDDSSPTMPNIVDKFIDKN